jgi:hypothetical protein
VKRVELAEVGRWRGNHRSSLDARHAKRIPAAHA